MKTQSSRRFPRRRDSSDPGEQRADFAFTLLEVMIACFVFFTVAFSVLALTTQGLVAAKSLRRHRLDPGLVAARLATNQVFEEGTFTMDLEEINPDFRDYSAQYRVEEWQSNRLFRVEIEVTSRKGNEDVPLRLTTFIHSSTSPPGKMSGALR